MKDPRVFMGVDPGVEGGLALVEEDGLSASVYPMPETQEEILLLVKEIAESDVVVLHCYLEKIPLVPEFVMRKKNPNFRRGQKGTAVLFENLGFLKACLSAFGFKVTQVSPVKWQRGMNCLTGGDKKVTRARAQQLFPSTRVYGKVTNKTADALLMAEYCRRVEGLTCAAA